MGPGEGGKTPGRGLRDNLMVIKDKDVFEKVMGFAKDGKGRRMLNALNRRDTVLTLSELKDVLKAYCETGLPREVEVLKSIRGILSEDQYHRLAEKVRANCCPEKYDEFAVSLRNLLTSGMKMNPAGNNTEGQG
jgi:hypothetical protein